MKKNKSQEKPKRKIATICHECLEPGMKGHKLIRFDKGDHYIKVHEDCAEFVIINKKRKKS